MREQSKASGDAGRDDGSAPPQQDAEIIEELLKKAKEKLLSDRATFSVGDLIKLLEARQELRSEGVEEIVVRWVDDSLKESGG